MSADLHNMTTYCVRQWLWGCVLPLVTPFHKVSLGSILSLNLEKGWYCILLLTITPWGVPATRHRLIATNSPKETKENTPVNLSVNVRAYYKHVRKQMDRCRKPGSIANWGIPASSQWPVTWLPGIQSREGQSEDFSLPSGLRDSLLSAADVTYFCVGSTVPVLGFTLVVLFLVLWLQLNPVALQLLQIPLEAL